VAGAQIEDITIQMAFLQHESTETYLEADGACSAEWNESKRLLFSEFREEEM
jgi:hypothetical protein